MKSNKIFQRVMKMESLNLDKQYLHNFGLKYNYRLIPQEQILSRCVQLGHIGHLGDERNDD